MSKTKRKMAVSPFFLFHFYIVLSFLPKFSAFLHSRPSGSRICSHKPLM
uniref:Uncharacterized protein n=1 Tax=Arundo donax TaxID=35708 RepID=A0A0A9FLE0_ARUDO